HEPCQTEADYHAFFERCGMLLCVIHVLHGNDAHAENVVASGPHPVLIDAETLVTPTITEINDAIISPDSPFQDGTLHYVLTTACLPEWRVDTNGRLYDMSALGHRGGQLMRRPVWENINTENMRQAYVPTPQPVSGNSPFSSTENYPGLENFIEDVI